MKKLHIILISIVLVGGFLFFYQKKLGPVTENNGFVPQTASANPVSALSSSLNSLSSGKKEGKIYSNEKRGFTFVHSPETTIREYDEGGGALTLVAEEGGTRGFQAFILPYKENVVTVERFQLDVPSGVMENETEVFIGPERLKGAAFESQDNFLGKTLEVWFIHDGHLYEITTIEENADWLAQILNSWVFSASQ